MSGRRGNLTALAVLSVAASKPMHPYEMGQAIRGWGKDRDMKVKWGSLYSVVAALEKRGLLEAAGTAREGNRPERTVYRVTAEGRAELADWTRELLATADGDHTRFRAGLSVAVVLPPDEVVEILRGRLRALETGLASDEGELHRVKGTVPRMFLIEDEYALATARAEIKWIYALVAELATGTFPELDRWRAFHEQGGLDGGAAVWEPAADRSGDRA
ncbi:PadR family transcriptional regulator [Glycomyces mayteni]|uniref:PadR family transcriptional regulator n=1 Tax=Glycomyces mayteni TaxID=543887 RepID=A0ABW2D6Q3_9ACTN|nr:PadR family transcriptional regulator [Glycomyces mayteni]